MEKVLTEEKIEKIADQLSHFLSDTFVLYVKTLNFHWNMTGPQFVMYHKLLQEQYEDLAEGADDLAERVRMLGKRSPGSMAEFLKLACLKEAKTNLSQNQMVEELVADHEEMVEHCHKLIEFVDSVLDQGTSDLLAERIRFHSKQAWVLRSHLE